MMESHTIEYSVRPADETAALDAALPPFSWLVAAPGRTVPHLVHLKVSVVIPCYNEEDCVERVYERVCRVLGGDERVSDHEILFVNDGSTDGTLALLREITSADSRAKCISFSRNFGQQAAMASGITACEGDVAIVMDADLQNPPEVITEMLDKYLEVQCDVVYAVKRKRSEESPLRRLTAKVWYRVLNYFSEIDQPVDTGDFKLLDRKVLEAFKQIKETNKYVRGLISWVGFIQLPVYYDVQPRAGGRTKYSIRSLLNVAFTATTYFSTKPLRLAIALGIPSLLVSLALIADVFVSKFSNPQLSVPGWASISLSIVFFGSVQLLTLGVLGLYVANIFDEVKRRPQYIVDERINFQ